MSLTPTAVPITMSKHIVRAIRNVFIIREIDWSSYGTGEPDLVF
jgi:hypothetical protein